MIIFGTRASTLQSFEVDNVECNYCNEKRTFHLTYFGKYLHIFWIPVIPIGKPAVAECTHCKRTIDKSQFNQSLNSFYTDNKSSAKRPIWHWIIPGLIALNIAIMLFSMILLLIKGAVA